MFTGERVTSSTGRVVSLALLRQKIAKGKRDIALAAERRAAGGVERAQMTRLRLDKLPASGGDTVASAGESKSDEDHYTPEGKDGESDDRYEAGGGGGFVHM